MSNDSTPSRLAILGGAPAFSEPLHVGRPNLGDYARFEARLREMWNRRWLTNDGPLVREFENTVAELLGVPHCIAVCNGTVGLEIAIQALELSGEVIVPSWTFVATAHALRWRGIRPVFCDIDPATHQICPSSVERLITPRTTGILAVHLWGNPCPVDELTSLADRHGLKLLFDAAHAFGSTYGGELIGRFGGAEVFSFHATKFVNAGEGGLIATQDDALAEKMRLMRNFGFAGYDNVVHLGTNGKMSEAAAAMGLTSLECMDSFIEVNRRNVECYRECLAHLPGLRILQTPSSERSNKQYVVMEVDAATCDLSRDELLAVLHAENVLVRRYFYPGCHRMEPYRAEPESTPCPLPHAEGVAERILQFPTGTSVTPEIISSIAGIMTQAVSQASKVRQRLLQLTERDAGLA